MCLWEEVVATLLCYHSELLPWPLVIEEANWLTLDKDVLAGDGFDAVICLGNSFAHLPDFKGKLVALAEAPALSSSTLADGWLVGCFDKEDLHFACLLQCWHLGGPWEGKWDWRPKQMVSVALPGTQVTRAITGWR